MALGDPVFDSNGRPLVTPMSLLTATPDARAIDSNPTHALPDRPMYQDADQTPVDTSTAFERGLRRSVAELGPEARSLYGLGQTALGNVEGGRRNIGQAQADIEAAEARDPHASLEDVVNRGASVGDFAADKIGSFVPDVASLLVPGGVGGKVATTVARGAVKKAVEGIAKDAAIKFAERTGVDAASDAAVAAGKRAAAIASKAGGDATVDAAATAGHAVGTAAGALPGAASGSNADVLDAKTDDEAQTRAQKGLAGAIPQAALAAVVPSRFLGKIAGDGAAEAVAKETQRFFPAVAKAAAKEGVSMAGLNVAQTATALATHSWMNDHLDVLPPGALMQYLDSAATGLLFGGAFGVAGHVGEAIKGSRADAGKAFQERVNAVRDKVRTVLGDTPQEAQDAAKPAPAADPNARTPEEQSAADLFKAHLDRLAGRADQDVESDQRLNDIESRHNAFTQSGAPVGGDAPRYTNPVQMPTKLQNTLMAFIPKDSALWLHEGVAKDVAKSAEKLFTGSELTDQDAKHIAALASVVGHDTVEHWAAVGPEFAKLTDLTKKVSADIPDNVPLTEQERNTQNVQELQKKLDGMAPEHPDRPAAEAALRDATSRVASSALDPHEEPRSVPADATEHEGLDVREPDRSSTLAHRVIEAEPGTIEHTAAQTALRESLIGHRDTDPNRPYREMRAGEGKNNVIVGNNDAQVQKTLKRGFEIDSDHPGKPLVVDIQNLVKKKLGGKDGERMAGDAFGALSEAVGDLHLAGVKIKPESIRPGVEYAPGAKLTPAQARMLRADATKVRDFQQRAAEKANAASAPERAKAEAARAARAERVEPIAKEKMQLDRAELEERQAGGEHDNRVDDTRLLERRAPPESPEPDSREPGAAAKVEQGGGIKDVQHVAPHDKTLNDAREKLLSARTPAERAAIKHDAGVNIGKRELDLQRERGQISGARYAREIKALNDYSTGSSRDYLTRAGRGDFDAFKTTESRSENAEPKENPKKVAEEEGTPATGASDPAHAAAKEDNDIHVGFKEANKGDGPHDHEKETRMLNALLKRLGVASQIRVKPLPDAMRKGRSGLYQPGASTIYVNPNLHGAKRLEVLTHELGHHIIIHELGSQLEKASPELRKGLLDDYNAWVEKNNQGGNTVSDVLASRKPYFRAQDVAENTTGLTVKELADTDPAKLKYLFDHEEYLADHIARALSRNGESQSIVEKFFDGIAELLRRTYETLFRAGADEGYKPAPSVEKWVQGLFDRNTLDASRALDESVPKATADAGIGAAVRLAHGDGGTPPPRGPGGVSSTPPEGRGSVLDEGAFAPFKKFVEARLTPDERGILERALYRQSILKKINERFGDDEKLQKAMENPADELASLFYVADKMMQDGSLKLGPKSTDVFLWMREQLFRILGVAGNNQYALKLFEDMRNGEIARTREAGNTYDVRQRDNDATTRPRIQKAFNDAYTIYRDQMYIPWRRAMYGSEANAHLSYTPALRDIASKFKLAQGAVGERHGYKQDIARRLQLFNTQIGKALNTLDTKEVTQLAQHLREQSTPTDPKLQRAAEAMHAVFRDARAYAREAGVPLGDRGPNFYPVVMDPTAVAARVGDFRRLLEQPKFAKAIKDAGLSVDKLVDMASRTTGERVGSTDPLAPPDFRAMSPRVMQFIYEHGDAADKKAFASFQQQDMRQAVMPYLSGLVNRAEYTRRAGVDGAKLKDAFEEANKQNALPQDIDYAKRAIAAMTGAYAADGSPLVRSLFGDKAAKWVTSPGVKNFTDGMMAYQNVRNLSLSLLSALADPMGIGVRYGGIKSAQDLRQAFKSFGDGLKSIAKSSSSAELREQASIIGLADDYMASAILSESYAPGVSGMAKSASDMMFRFNGLTPWVRSTRFMALSAANAFLLKHAAGKDPKHSVRYLRELGVKADDISQGSSDGLVKLLTPDEIKTATPEARAADERVKAALNRFVDEAILRTDPSQAPLYFNDPAARLVTQYQQFAYAFDSQILARIGHEFNYSNFGPFAPLLGYIPVTLAGEFARSFIQYGPGGNPNRADWDTLDYTDFAAQRAGLLGPRIQFATNAVGLGEAQKYGNLLGIEPGPTLQQAGEVAKTLEGKFDVGHTLTDALPASNIYKHW